MSEEQKSQGWFFFFVVRVSSSLPLPWCKGNKTAGFVKSGAWALPTNSRLGDLALGSPRSFPPAGLSSGLLAGILRSLLCQGAADDVIPLPQTRCGEHGRSPGGAKLHREEGTIPTRNGDHEAGKSITQGMFWSPMQRSGYSTAGLAKRKSNELQWSDGCKSQLPPLLHVQPIICLLLGPAAWPRRAPSPLEASWQPSHTES